MTQKKEQTQGLDWQLVKRLLPYVKKQIGLTLTALIVVLILDFLTVLQPYLIKSGIDNYILKNDLPGLTRLCMIILIVMAVTLAFQTTFAVLVQYLGQKLLLDLRLDLFKKVLNLSNRYFDTTSGGRTLTNLTSDVEAIRQFISEGIVSLTGDFIKVFFILGAMFYVDKYLALLTFLTLPVFIIATALFRKSIRAGFDGVRKSNSEINTSLVETITGIKEIHLFSMQKGSRKQFTESNNRYLNAYLKVVHSFALYFPVLEIVSNLGMVLIFVFIHFRTGKQLDVGVIFAFFSYINMFFRPLRQMAEKFNMFQSAMAASQRTFTLLDEPVDIQNTDSPIRGFNVQGETIAFNDVSFSYSEDKTILDNISFTIKPGEKIAIVGSTGSGKTTIINLINRLYDVTAGSITVGDKDLRELDLSEWRSHISTLPQETFLFSGTISENITMLDSEIPYKKLVYAAEQACADRFINRLPKKYAEPVLEEGKNLSTGEKQLMSFARAFLKQPSLVILDEATANIDSATEKLIEQAISNLFENRSAIIIAHRLSTIKSADRIIVLNKGNIVEEGTHESLIAQDTIYRKLFETQAFLLQ